jgi:hypothetical protein
MTEEMLELARAHASEAGVNNVEFVKGYLDAIPLEADSAAWTGCIAGALTEAALPGAAALHRLLRAAGQAVRRGV